jgi:uncharacterized protein YjbI with pentapeptide repeats
MTAEEFIAILNAIRDGHATPDKKPSSLEGMSFAGLDLSGLDLSGMNLRGCDFSGADLSGAQLFNADLTSALLREANLAKANLSGAILRDADLGHARARQAGFGMAILERTVCFQGDFEECSFTKSILSHADFRCANLIRSRFREADLRHSDFTECALRSSDFSLSRIDGAVFNNADLRDARLRRIVGFRSAHWIGTDIRDVNFAGAYMLRRIVLDQNYLKEFRSESGYSRILYVFWKATSDCGRSMGLWFLWIIVLILFFAWVYTWVGIDYGKHPTSLSPLYYSVVTFTTLGYGDVMPSTVGGQIAAMAEAFVGYLMLGGLLAILSSKIARRAD